MWRLTQRFWTNSQGQDITEYSLLLAFVVLAAAGIFLVNASSLTSIWQSANSVVSRAATATQAS